MAITTINNRAVNRSDTASSGQLWTATSATASDFQAAAASGFTMSSVTATTSGTLIDFTSIPAGTKIIHINFHEVSLSGTDNFIIQLGDSGGVETSAYYSYGGRLNDSVAGTSANSTAGLLAQSASAGYGTNGTATLCLVDSSAYIWTMNFQGLNVASHSGDDTTQYYVIGSCQKTLSAELDRVRIDTTGSDTFDDGKISILYI
tara:strand:+ start:1959 stop:2570 length:612 start_codon:yes stop_codon:yes gene_type:complete